MMRKIKLIAKLLILPVATILLVNMVSCSPVNKTPMEFPTNIEARLSTEAYQAIKQGKSKEALQEIQQLYKTETVLSDSTVLNYAQLLRHDRKPKTAVKIINKYLKLNENASPVLLNELAANQIETGDFAAAKKTLNEVLDNKEAANFHYDAYNLMGISLDAEGRHEHAERYFRKALENWRGDAISVKNNLAVCLASQGKFDEALMHLRQALIEAPKREELIRNIELITSLRESIIPKPNMSKGMK